MFLTHDGQQLSLDKYLELLQRMQPVRIWDVLPVDVLHSPGLISGPAMVQRLVVNDHTLHNDISIIASEQMYWGRMLAQAQRAEACAARKLRVWKAEQELALRLEHATRKPPEKAPSKDLIEATYRTTPGYGVVEGQAEEITESRLAIDAIYKAFGRKGDVLERDVFRVADGTLQRRAF